MVIKKKEIIIKRECNNNKERMCDSSSKIKYNHHQNEMTNNYFIHIIIYIRWFYNGFIIIKHGCFIFM